MTRFIGIDEAGYGPNFGPLCIGATAWGIGATAWSPGTTGQNRKVQAKSGKGNPENVDFYALLEEAISPSPAPNRIAIADSKLLYKPRQGLAHLERGVLAPLTALGSPVLDWQTLLAPPALPWYAGYDCSLPIDMTREEITELAQRFSASCQTASVRLLDMRARSVFPQEFNELTEHYGSKGAALSHLSIGLLKTILTRNSQLATRNSITCDKHGGRNRYAALLQHHFPEEQIEILEESRPVSRYRWGPPESRTDICFRTRGEAELPVALASMLAKYHRELAMRAFNAFWIRQIPGLKPTAGYPQDAKRFKSEIAAVQSKLGIEDRILWRNK